MMENKYKFCKTLIINMCLQNNTLGPKYKSPALVLSCPCLYIPLTTACLPNLNMLVHVGACPCVSGPVLTRLSMFADDAAMTAQMLLTSEIYARLLGASRTSVGLSFSCPKCGNAYARPHSLSRHIRFECGVAPKFECPICHKKSKHKHNLMLHMRTHQNR